MLSGVIHSIWVEPRSCPDDDSGLRARTERDSTRLPPKPTREFNSAAKVLVRNPPLHLTESEDFKLLLAAGETIMQNRLLWADLGVGEAALAGDLSRSSKFT